jgi:serine/threonine protein kinase
VTVAPRARLFLATAATGDVRRLPLSRSLFQAPEMLAGARATPACDVFSLAAILALLTSGEHPFEGAGEPALALAISMDRRRPWHGPAALGDLVARALRPEPAARLSLPELLARLRL